MIGVFFGTPNVYRPQWHPEPPPLARPGLLQTVSPVPIRKPDCSLAPWFDTSWTIMGAPWLTLKRTLLTPPGTVGLPIPPPMNPVSSKPWQQPDWTMDAPWLLLRRPGLTVRDASLTPTVTPRVNLSRIFQPDWIMDAPWQWDKISQLLPPSAVAPTPPPTSPSAVNVSPFFPPWDLRAPWGLPAPKFTRDASLPWMVAPASFVWHHRTPDWELLSPWRAIIDKPFTADASLPPLRPMEAMKWFQRVADWSSDAPPWQWQRIQTLLPLGTPGLSIPPPPSPINMALWLQPAWTMDSPWQWEKITLQTPPSTVTIFPPPTRNPEANWLTQFFPSWDLRTPWSVPGPKFTPDASLPPLRPMEAMKWFQRVADWQSDAPPWLWQKWTLLTPSSGITILPPPVRMPDSNWLTEFVPAWTLTSPWSVPAAQIPKDASLPPTLAPMVNLSPFFPAWILSEPWNVPSISIPKDTSIPPLLAPPTNLSPFFIAWALTAPWTAPPIKLVADGSKPPLRPMESRRWFQQVPEWQIDAPWQWQQIFRQIPTANPARLTLIDLFVVRCARTSPILVICARTTPTTVRVTKTITQSLIL